MQRSAVVVGVRLSRRLPESHPPAGETPVAATETGSEELDPHLKAPNAYKTVTGWKSALAAYSRTVPELVKNAQDVLSAMGNPVDVGRLLVSRLLLGKSTTTRVVEAVVGSRIRDVPVPHPEGFQTTHLSILVCFEQREAARAAGKSDLGVPLNTNVSVLDGDWSMLVTDITPLPVKWRDDGVLVEDHDETEGKDHRMQVVRDYLMSKLLEPDIPPVLAAVEASLNALHTVANQQMLAKPASVVYFHHSSECVYSVPLFSATTFKKGSTLDSELQRVIVDRVLNSVVQSGLWNDTDLRQPFGFGPTVLEYCAEEGLPRCSKTLLQLNVHPDGDEEALKQYYLGILKIAISGGCLDAIKVILQHLSGMYSSSIYRLAVKSAIATGNVMVTQYLLRKAHLMVDVEMVELARTGNHTALEELLHRSLYLEARPKDGITHIEPQDLMYPWSVCDVAFGEKGLIAVTDTYHRCIRIVDVTTGECIKTLTGQGSLKSPRGVAFDCCSSSGSPPSTPSTPVEMHSLSDPVSVIPKGFFIVSDTDLNAIFVIDAHTDRVVHHADHTNLGLSKPSGIALHKATSVLAIADRGNDRIVFVQYVRPGIGDTVSGTIPSVSMWSYVPGFGGSAQDQQLNHPSGVSFNAKGDLLAVADTENHKVKVFDVETGQLKTVISKHLNWPEAVAFDHRNDRIVIANSFDHKVQIYDASGHTCVYTHENSKDFGLKQDVPVTHISAEAEPVGTPTKPAQGSPTAHPLFNAPCGVAVVDTGAIVVASRDNHSVIVIP